MTDISTIAADAAKALEAVPTITSAISGAQAALTDDQHKDVLTKATDLLGVAATSAAALGASGVIGQNDAANVQTGAEIATTGVGIVGEIEALIAKVKSFIASL